MSFLSSVLGTVDILSDFGSLIYDVIKEDKWEARRDADYNLQSPEWLWKKQQLEIERQREDNSVQRRTQDMIKAGINPVLSAGTGASSSASGSSISTSVAQNNREKVQSMLAIANAVEQNSLLNAQVELAKAEEKGKKLDNKIKPIVMARELVNVENAKKDGAYKDLHNTSLALDNDYKAWDNAKSYSTGISKENHPLAKVVRDESALLQDYVRAIGEGTKKGAYNVSKKVRGKVDDFRTWYKNKLTSSR